MPLGPALASDFPQVERAVRIELQGCKVYLENRGFDELVYFADAGYFDMFSFPLKAGNPQALNEPNAVFLSAEFAQKYFNGEEAIGKNIIIVFENQAKKICTVSGVAEPFPENAGFKFDILTGFSTLETFDANALLDWKTYNRGTFVQLRQPEDAGVLAENMGKYVAAHNAANEELQITSFVFDNLRHPNPNAYEVYSRPAFAAPPVLTLMFALIALLMMALSCFNYINIALGFVGKRLKEIGVRKVIGGKKIQLIVQFMFENLLLCLLALLLGLALTEAIFIPVLNSIMVVKISLSFTENPWLWAFLAGLLAFTGIASGAYPAFYLSSLQPVSIFKDRQLSGSKSILPRLLLAIQFILAFSTVIIGVVLLVAGKYWQDLPWGYQPDQTLVVRLDHSEQYRFLQAEAERSAYVLEVAGAANHIGESLARENIFVGQEKLEAIRFDVGAGYFETMGLQLLAGRFFDPNRPYEGANTVVVNKTFVKERNWAEPIGQQIKSGEHMRTVIGVVDDFKIIGSGATRPVVFHPAEEGQFAYLVMRYVAGAGNQLETFMKSAWQGLYPEIPFNYFHQNLVFENFYRSFNNVASVFSYLAGLALIIACLGLFGLASQNYASHLKEVSIRKILGASVTDTVLLANRAFLLILLIASVVATGMCYAGVRILLAAFEAYTGAMELGFAPYLVANFLVFLTAAIAISGQSYKLAKASPVVSLRNE
jgi:ABC-type antimicrobial peptide transport system permease subunit